MKKLKHFFRSFIMCQSMFMSIPIPCRVWNEDARRDMLLFLPLIGLEIGLLWAGIGWVCRHFELSSRIEGLILCAFPLLITGGIHMDGFMDVTDAVFSWRSPEKRREILKDPHTGSFAVIGCVLVLLSNYVFLSEGGYDIRALIFIPVISRTLSALSVLNFPPMPGSQYAPAFKRSAWRSVLLVFVFAAAAVLSFTISGRYGFLCAAQVLGYGAALGVGIGRLGGMNGDISGFALTISETAALVLCAVL